MLEKFKTQLLLVIIAGLLSCMMMSCKKEEIKPKPAPVANVDCKCGVVLERTSEGVTFNNGGSKSWSMVRVKNYCTGNIRKFEVWTQPFMYVQVGDTHCAWSQW